MGDGRAEAETFEFERDGGGVGAARVLGGGDDRCASTGQARDDSRHTGAIVLHAAPPLIAAHRYTRAAATYPGAAPVSPAGTHVLAEGVALWG